MANVTFKSLQENSIELSPPEMQTFRCAEDRIVEAILKIISLYNKNRLVPIDVQQGSATTGIPRRRRRVGNKYQ